MNFGYCSQDTEYMRICGEAIEICGVEALFNDLEYGGSIDNRSSLWNTLDPFLGDVTFADFADVFEIIGNQDYQGTNNQMCLDYDNDVRTPERKSNEGIPNRPMQAVHFVSCTCC